MATKAIVSYDDTLNDLDALALARILAGAGAELTLAYVRHTTQTQRAREQLEEHEAQALLERGARWLGDLNVERRVLVSPSTGKGLRWLAEREGADIVVFGSDYRTAAGHVALQQSTQALLEGGPTALAIAPANYRSGARSQIAKIGVLAGPRDPSALSTARELADHFEASMTSAERDVDLLVVGSRAEAREGQVMITAQAQHAIDNASSPVLVVPRGVALRFEQPAAIA